MTKNIVPTTTISCVTIQYKLRTQYSCP